LDQPAGLLARWRLRGVQWLDHRMARHTTACGDLPGEYLDGPGFQCPAVCGCGIGEPAPVQSLIEDSAPAACADSSRGRRTPPAVMSPTAARTCRCTDLNIYCTQRSDLRSSHPPSDRDLPRTRSLLRSGSLALRPTRRTHA